MVPHPPIIIPDIGKGEEKKIQKTIDAYHAVARKIGSLKPDTIVLMSPHQILYSDYFHISPGKSASGDMAQFRAPHVQMEVRYDTEFVKQICKLADAADFPAGTEGERDKRLDHGTMVPLYFVNQYLKDYRLVRIGLSGLPLKMHYQLGQYIQEADRLLNRTTVLVASGDLSHRLKEDGPYGYQKEGPEYDSRIMDVMGKAAFGELLEFLEDLCEKAGECGHRSFTIMAGALDKLKVEAEALSYEGVFGVGYGICSYTVCGSDAKRNFKEQFEEKERAKIAKQREQEDAYVQLARKTIENYVRTGETIAVPDGLPSEMYSQRAGVFVSVKENGSLRGCIGTIHAVRTCVAEEIIENAISAACRDPRFLPIRQEELDELMISVDVLGDTEAIDTPDQLDVKRYGVIVTNGYKRGLLLPNLDGVDTIEEQIAIAKHKAGIGEKEDITLERFEVIRHY
ncbi:MAG: AmmeMemoRadiSam system protein A [Lachnospiraceae bacterium]|nr:AmmeMemoRadiSam system protein A [Lachnospiraceae bacterium]